MNIKFKVWLFKNTMKSRYLKFKILMAKLQNISDTKEGPN